MRGKSGVKENGGEGRGEEIKMSVEVDAGQMRARDRRGGGVMGVWVVRGGDEGGTICGAESSQVSQVSRPQVTNFLPVTTTGSSEHHTTQSSTPSQHKHAIRFQLTGK